MLLSEKKSGINNSPVQELEPQKVEKTHIHGLPISVLSLIKHHISFRTLTKCRTFNEFSITCEKSALQSRRQTQEKMQTLFYLLMFVGASRRRELSLVDELLSKFTQRLTDTQTNITSLRPNNGNGPEKVL